MIDRRLLLTTAAGFAGFLSLKWLTGAPAIAASDEKFEVMKTDEEWRKQLTPQQYEILRKEGTERPYSSPLLKEKRKGTFACSGCDNALFSSDTKYDSGTGWPSFYKPIGAVVEKRDTTAGMTRVEVRSKLGDSHLGHVFDDGPKPTGLRYCINSAALRFIPVDQLEAQGYGEYKRSFRSELVDLHEPRRGRSVVLELIAGLRFR